MSEISPYMMKWEESMMNGRWCITENAFEKDDGLWWLKKEQYSQNESSITPMEVALKNGDISKIIDTRFNGLLTKDREQGSF
jgi:hypothetical protein